MARFKKSFGLWSVNFVLDLQLGLEGERKTISPTEVDVKRSRRGFRDQLLMACVTSQVISLVVLCLEDVEHLLQLRAFARSWEGYEYELGVEVRFQCGKNFVRVLASQISYL